ncbi:MAG: hypothetical protein ACJAV1_003299, partial [Paraglaciecola sp.]
CRRKKLDVIRRQLPDIIEQKDNEKTNSPTTCWPCPNCKVGVLMLMSIALPSINVQEDIKWLRLPYDGLIQTDKYAVTWQVNHCHGAGWPIAWETE